MVIQQIDIKGLWNGAADICWRSVDPRVNILVGNNGSGKSTLLKILQLLLSGDAKAIKGIEKVTLQTTSGNVVFEEKAKLQITGTSEVYYVNTFDIPSSKKSAQSQLTQQLDTLLYQRQKDVYSFTDYRLSMTNSDLDNVSQSHIDDLFSIINSLFSTTGKTIRINERNEIVFDKGETVLTIEQLSSGEKQMLILLFTVFLMKQKSSVLLLDEPEISLHMAWQDKLIENLLAINPNCQIFLTTHSPNIFADGWGDKLVFMGNIIQEK